MKIERGIETSPCNSVCPVTPHTRPEKCLCHDYHHDHDNPTPRIALFVRPSGTKFQPHHRYMQHSQGSNITDVCIMHICVMIKEHMYMHRAYMHHVYMHLLESPSPLVPPLPKSFAS